MAEDRRILRYKKTTIIVFFDQEVDENGVVQTTARTDFLREAPGVCTPLTVEATDNTRERALQTLIHKIKKMIDAGTLIYKEHRYDPSTANIFKAPPQGGVKVTPPEPVKADPLPVVKRPLVTKPKFEGKPGDRIIVLENMEEGRQPYARLIVVQEGEDSFTVPEIDIWGHGCDREAAEYIFEQKRWEALTAVEAKAKEIFDLTHDFIIYEYRYSDHPTLSSGAFSKNGWDAHRKTVIFALAAGHEAEFHLLKCNADNPIRFREALTLIHRQIDQYFEDKSEIRPGDPEKALKEVRGLCKAYLASCSPTKGRDYEFEDPAPVADPKKARGIMELILRACQSIEAPPHDPELALNTIRTMAEESLKPVPPRKEPEPNPLLELLPKLLDAFKALTGCAPTPPEGADKKLKDDLDACVEEFTEGLKKDKETLDKKRKAHKQPPEQARERILNILTGTSDLPDAGRDVLESVIQEAVRGILTPDLPVGGGAVEGGPLPAFWKLLLPIQEYMRTKKKPEPKPKAAKPSKDVVLDAIVKLKDHGETLLQRKHRENSGSAQHEADLKRLSHLLTHIEDTFNKLTNDPPPPYRSVEKDALDSIMKIIEESLAFGGRADRPLGAILDQIIHEAAKALLTSGYYENSPTIRDHLDAVVRVMEARQNKA